MNGIDYIARILKQEGVEWMSCFPSNPLISAVARVGIRPIAFRHERGAVMAADGYSRISDRQKFGVCAMQAQAGAENAMGGIAQAYADNIPILVFLGGNNLDRLSVKPNFTASQAQLRITGGGLTVGPVVVVPNALAGMALIGLFKRKDVPFFAPGRSTWDR